MHRVIFLISILYILLSASTCNKDECNRSFFIENNSQDEIIIALLAKEGNSNQCRLDGNAYASGEIFELDLPRTCWEDELNGNKTQDVYIIDPTEFNDQDEFYDCDSIEFRNTILRKYELSLQDLERSDFRISYP